MNNIVNGIDVTNLENFAREVAADDTKLKSASMSTLSGWAKPKALRMLLNAGLPVGK